MALDKCDSFQQRSRVKLLTIKTARFAAVVEKCGPPEVYTLWQDPKRDRTFQSLLKNSRVLSVLESETGTAFGCVGLSAQPQRILLAFPKSLRRFEAKRIVGIKWNLVKS